MMIKIIADSQGMIEIVDLGITLQVGDDYYLPVEFKPVDDERGPTSAFEITMERVEPAPAELVPAQIS